MSNGGSQLKAQVNKLLTNVSNAYVPEGLVADLLLPRVEVAQDSGILGYYGKDHLRIEQSYYGGQGKARKVQPIVRKTDRTYLIETHGLQSEITEADYRNVEDPFSAESDEVMGLTTILGLEKEYSIASALGDTAVLTRNTTLAGTSQWSDYNNSNPVKNIKDAQNSVISLSGKKANRAIVPALVANTLRYHPQVLSNLGFSANRAGQLTDQEIANFLGVQKIFIPDANYNTAKEGQADSMTQIWGNNVILYHAPDSPGKLQVTLGYMLVRSGTGGRRVKMWDIPDSFGNKGVLVDDNYQFKLVDTDAAYLIKAAIA